MEKFGFNYHGKKIILDVAECKNIFSQSRGLMFRKKSKPLLFTFKKPVKISIHSFFCMPFVAIWFNKNKIVDVKIIKNWMLSITPKKEFDKLLEIPSGDKNFKKFIDERNI